MGLPWRYEPNWQGRPRGEHSMHANLTMLFVRPLGPVTP